jgi:hypothetical protein
LEPFFTEFRYRFNQLCIFFRYPFTRTAVTSLSINIAWVAPESCVSAFLVDIAAVLEENASLEHLTMNAKSVNVEDFLALVSSLQGNTTLETLHLVSYRDASGIILEMTDDEVTGLTSSIKMNYGLEALPDIDPDDRTKYLDAILRLNRAGRRYLAKDGSSISKGVEEMSAVSDDLNCVFLHLSENPRLCDRSAIETTTTNRGGSNRSTDPVDRSGKRVQDNADEGKVSRQRLTSTT